MILTGDKETDRLVSEFEDAWKEQRAASIIRSNAVNRKWEALKKLRSYIVKEFGKTTYEILKFRFGREPKCLLEAGKKFNISRERVRQLEDRFIDRFKINPKF